MVKMTHEQRKTQPKYNENATALMAEVELEVSKREDRTHFFGSEALRGWRWPSTEAMAPLTAACRKSMWILKWVLSLSNF